MRDNQRKRLYDAENSVRQVARGKDLPTVPEMQAYVNRMLSARWFVSRFGEQIGPEARKALGDAFFDYKVDIDLLAVPKPNPARVRAVNARKRERVQSQRAAKTRPVNKDEAKQAADAIRRAVRAGTFGPAGCKPRTHALATARLLDSAR